MQKCVKYGFAAVGAVLSLKVVSQLPYYKEKIAKRNLIKWSEDGTDFVGPVEYTNAHQPLNRKSFLSPKGNMEVYIDHGMVISTYDNRMIQTKKELWPDGNTAAYEEFCAFRTCYYKRWASDGTELSPQPDGF